MSNRYKPIYNNAVYPDTSRDEIRRELTWYRENGYGGFAVNGAAREPIQDVSDWLPGYLRSVRAYCDEAKALGLDMWIFDEWGYPSGCACGLVLTPETRAKKLNKALDITLSAGESLDMPAPARLLCAGAIPVNRFGPYHPDGPSEPLDISSGRVRYTARRDTRVVGVTWEPHSFVTHVMKDYREGDPTIGTVDILDRACVRKFIHNMHERYAPVIGDEFGKTVKGFFYDEPEVCWEFPFTHDLPAWFRARHGYDMLEILPELVAYTASECGVTGGGDAYPRLKKYFSDYTDAWTSLLADSFYGQIEAWCHERGLLSVGHQDLDNHAETLVTVSGDFFRNSARNDRPGVDVIWDNIFPDRFDDFPRFAGSLKRLWGKSGAMSETFAEMGECMPPDVMRYVMEHQIIRGIDQFFLYTTHNSHPQKDPNVGVFTKALMERTARVAELLNQGEPRAQIALLVPLKEIAFERARSNPHQINGTPLPWERLDAIAQALCYAPVDYDYAWEEGLDGLYQRGFRHLILTGNELSEKTLLGVKAFHDAGGAVWSAYTPTPGAPFARHMASLRQLIDALPREVDVAYGAFPVHRVSVTSRDTENGVLYAALNETNDLAEVSFGEKTKDLYQLDIQSGKWSYCGTSIFLMPRELAILRVGPAPSTVFFGTQAVQPRNWALNGKPLPAFRPWTELGLEGYTGWGVYETEFDWDGGPAHISLGEVGYSARVTLDGQTYDVPFSPWSFRANISRGRHTLRVQVLNSLASRTFSENPDHRWSFEQAYLKCGLLSGVTIEGYEEISPVEKQKRIQDMVEEIKRKSREERA